MKHFLNVCIKPQPCHSHVCCWLLWICPSWMFGLKMDFIVCADLVGSPTDQSCIFPFWAENGSYGLCLLGSRYNRSKLSFSWTYALVSMIWNAYDLSASHLSYATASFVVDCCQFGPRWIFGLKMDLMAFADLVGGTSDQSCIFPDLILKYQ